MRWSNSSKLCRKIRSVGNVGVLLTLGSIFTLSVWGWGNGDFPERPLGGRGLWRPPAHAVPNLNLSHPRIFNTALDIERAVQMRGESGPRWAQEAYADLLHRANLDPIMRLNSREIRAAIQNAVPSFGLDGRALGTFIDTTTRSLETLAYAWAWSREPAYAEKVAVVLDALAARYVSDGDSRLDRRAYQVGRTLSLYALAYDLTVDSGEYQEPSPTNPGVTVQENVVYNLLLNGAEFCYQESQEPAFRYQLHNGTAEYVKAYFLVGSLFGIETYMAPVVEGPHSLQSFIDNAVGCEGSYFETSMMYSMLARGIYLEAAEALANLSDDRSFEQNNHFNSRRFFRFLVEAPNSQRTSGLFPAYGDSVMSISERPLERWMTRAFNHYETGEVLVGTADQVRAAYDRELFHFALPFLFRATDESIRTAARSVLLALSAGEPESVLASAWRAYVPTLRPVGPHRALLKLDGTIESSDEKRALETGRSTLLAQKGLAFLRHGESVESERGVMLRYGPTLNHGQHDGMSLLFFADGRDLTFDPGHWWGHSRHGWTKTTVAHNTVVVDGENRDDVPTPGGLLELFVDGNEVSVVAASDPGAYASHGVTDFSRTLVFVKIDADRSYAIDHFRVAGGSQRDYSFHGAGRDFEFGPGVTDSIDRKSLFERSTCLGDRLTERGFIRGAEGHEEFWEPSGNGYGFLCDPVIADGSKQWSATWKTGGRLGGDLRLTMLAAPERTVLVAAGPEHMGVKYVLARDVGTGVSDFVGVIEHGGSISQSTIRALDVRETTGGAPGLVALEVVHKGRKLRDVVIVNRNGDGVNVDSPLGRISTDARVVVVRRDGAGRFSAWVMSGSNLSVDSQQVSLPRELRGTVLEVDHTSDSLVVDFGGQVRTNLAGLTGVTEFGGATVRPPIQIDRAVPEGAGIRLFIKRSGLVVARVKVEDVLSDGRIRVDIALPWAKTVRRSGNNGFYDGRLVRRSDGESAVLRTVGDDGRSLLFGDSHPFSVGDELWIDAVKSGDRMRVPLWARVTWDNAEDSGHRN